MIPATLNLNEARLHLPIVLMSFGVKSGQLFPPADLYLDCRGCADPSHVMSGTGDDPEVQEWVWDRSANILQAYRGLIWESISRLTTRRGAGKEFDKPFVILTMCAHGIHRSRAMKHILGRWLRADGFSQVEVK